MNKLRINLLRDELVAQKTWLTLTNVVRVWAASFILFVLASVYSQYNYSSINSEYQKLNKKHVQLTNQLEQYEEVLSSRSIDTKLTNKLATLKFVFQNKQILHRQLTDQTQVQVSGFADIMTELASYHSREISLQKINIANGKINLSGLARSADSVPNWLTGFAQSAYMANKNFSHFNLSATDSGDIQFVVYSGLLDKENK
ncbi:PilN domain-containing protein [Thalassomonas sp. M1454]|uniref:PilN domain-containing protein n=1 Tax=Thalassomonas sp. M1454 TaxID=2594477 RepID=UPI001180A5C6|nr:PilN domain-containing protein [Thalassomonas sp. M1454]TRX52814.1 hypothetical protein FNN08_15765 [Thalassomonas sp. M1454]